MLLRFLDSAGKWENMSRIIAICVVLVLASACSTFRASGPDRYVVFFSPRTAQLTPEAQQVVRQAAVAAQKRKASEVEIAVPPEAPSSSNLVEGRYTAIQNIFSATGIDAKHYARAVLSADATTVPGGNDRAEIRLVP